MGIGDGGYEIVFRVPRCYVWEATKWINEKEKSEDGKRDRKKERREMLRWKGKENKRGGRSPQRGK